MSFRFAPVIEAVDTVFLLEAKNGSADDLPLVTSEQDFSFSFSHVVMKEVLEVNIRRKTASDLFLVCISYQPIDLRKITVRHHLLHFHPFFQCFIDLILTCGCQLIPYLSFAL